MEEHNRKKEEKEANQKKREIAELKAARENAERKLAALTDKQEKTQDELSKIGLGRFFGTKSTRERDSRSRNGARQLEAKGFG